MGTPEARSLLDGGLLWPNLDADGPLALLLHAQMLLYASNDIYLGAVEDMGRLHGSAAQTGERPAVTAERTALRGTWRISASSTPCQATGSRTVERSESSWAG